MVPMVETVVRPPIPPPLPHPLLTLIEQEQATSLSRWAHYPSPTFPQGTRGCGGLFAPPNFSLSQQSYLLHANTLITVIVQIETRLGVQNCAEIAAVEGIDALFIGPNDLASSLGHFAFDHPKIPEVQEASQKVLEAAKEKGKFAGYFCMGAEDAAKRVREGWDFVNCGADLIALTAWMTGEMERLRGLVGEGKES